MIDRRTAPIGAVIAGGAGRRIGGSKALTALAGRPLISYPLAALRAVLDEVVVVAKASTLLPELEETLWIEPEEPQHPLLGIVEALRRAGGRPVLIAACDMPLLDEATVRMLAAADPQGAPAVIAADERGLQPLLGCYQPDALPRLVGNLAAARPLRELVEELEPRIVHVPSERLFNVNSAADLEYAEALLMRANGS